MTDEQINIKIALILGLEVCNDPSGPIDPRNPKIRCNRKVFYTSSASAVRRRNWPNSAHVRIIPNYASDLNACHEFAAWLDPEQQIQFAVELRSIVLENTHKAWWDATAIEVFQITNATALQRCEAFLRIHGQWEEEA